MSKPAKATDLIARMQAKARRDEQMARIKVDHEPWKPGEWEEFRDSLNANPKTGAELVSYLCRNVA